MWDWFYRFPAIVPTTETKEQEESRVMQEMETKEEVKYAKPIETIQVPKEEEEVVEVAKNDEFDIDKLARCVAKAETANFTRGYGLTHNNWQGIKHWNTAPCPWVPKLAMCKFESQEASNEAFKKIRSTWYKWIPTYSKADKWTGWDRTQNWMNIVLQCYNN